MLGEQLHWITIVEMQNSYSLLIRSEMKVFSQLISIGTDLDDRFVPGLHPRREAVNNNKQHHYSNPVKQLAFKRHLLLFVRIIDMRCYVAQLSLFTVSICATT